MRILTFDEAIEISGSNSFIKTVIGSRFETEEIRICRADILLILMDLTTGRFAENLMLGLLKNEENRIEFGKQWCPRVLHGTVYKDWAHNLVELFFHFYKGEKMSLVDKIVQQALR